MAQDFLTYTGLEYYDGRLKALVASKTELQAVEDKVDEIIAEGGEPNTIESISVNGTPVVPDAQKNVALTVPTKTSDLTNDGDGTSNFATEAYVAANGGKIDKVQKNGTDLPINNKVVNVEVPTKLSELQNDGDGTTGSEYATKSYVDTNGGKIDTISVNGTQQTITNKNVDITVPTQVSDLTNDSGFQTQTEVQNAISQAVASAYKYKGSVATYADLPSSGQTAGDVWDVQETGVNYAWTGTAWDALGNYVDTSLYWTNQSGQNNSLIPITTAQIDALFAS